VLVPVREADAAPVPPAWAKLSKINAANGPAMAKRFSLFKRVISRSAGAS